MRTAFLVLLFGSIGCIAQHIGVAVSAERVLKPKFAAEPQRKLGQIPLLTFRDVVSGEPSARTRALGQLLGKDPTEIDMPAPPDTSIRCVNLDEDPESECILQLNLPFALGSVLLIADRKADGWYIVGQFGYSWHWNADTAVHFAEVRSPYILVRDIGGGTGAATTMLSLYRLWRGSLYKTVSLEESRYTTAYGTTPLQTRTTEIRLHSWT